MLADRTKQHDEALRLLFRSIFSFTVLLSFATIASAHVWRARVGIEERARRLGVPGGSDDLADVQALSRTPYESVGALISELHTIANPERAGLDDSPATEHLISTIAALRYITGGSDFYTASGKDFCAKTKWKFTGSDEEENRLYWLYFDHPNCVTFFSIWPSRYRVYLAPLDAQQEIIRQWRQWYATSGKAYRFGAPPDSPEKRSLLWQCARAVYSPLQAAQEYESGYFSAAVNSAVSLPKARSACGCR